MINFKNILYPIDLDSDNVSSLIKALEFAQMFNAQVHIPVSYTHLTLPTKRIV